MPIPRLGPLADTAPGLPERWSALGTYVVLRVSNPTLTPDATRLVRDVLDEVDRTCSRFRADSELSRANAAAGRWSPASPTLIGAVTVALRAAVDTEGLVDPGLGELIRAAGYDRTFAQVRPSLDPVCLPLPPTAHWSQIDLRDDAIRVPSGLALDLGATGKAYAADLAALAVADALGADVVLSVGGDVRAARMDPPDSGERGRGSARHTGWSVDIGPDLAWLEGPRGPVTRVTLDDGGLATSSRTARRWRRGGQVWHHVFDPRTGRPADGPWISATAWGPTAAQANTLSTAALVLGAGAPEWIDARGAAVLLTRADGTTWASAAWARAIGIRPGEVA